MRKWEKRHKSGRDRKKKGGKRRDREVTKNIEQKQQDPGRAMDRALDPGAVPRASTKI